MTQRVKRAVIHDGELVRIPLTRGYLAVIDAEDAPLVSGYNWFVQVQPNGLAYAFRMSARSEGARRMIAMHRVIAGDPKGLEIDHRDGDGLNNRRGNLREATRLQNQYNRRLNVNNTSGYRGVTYDKQHAKW